MTTSRLIVNTRKSDQKAKIREEETIDQNHDQKAQNQEGADLPIIPLAKETTNKKRSN